MDNTVKKILVQGSIASGKTTFAEKLHEKNKFPLVRVDEIIWQPGWVHRDNKEISTLLLEKSGQEYWIIEGYINDEAIEELVTTADLILYLDYSRFVPVWRYLKRYFLHHKIPRKELPGCPEHFKISSLLEILRKKHVRKLEQLLKKSSFEEKVIRFKNLKQAEAYLEKYGK